MSGAPHSRSTQPMYAMSDSDDGATESLARHVCYFLLASLDGLLPCDRVAVATLESQGKILVLRASAASQPDRAIPARYTGFLVNSSLQTLSTCGQ